MSTEKELKSVVEEDEVQDDEIKKDMCQLCKVLVKGKEIKPLMLNEPLPSSFLSSVRLFRLFGISCFVSHSESSDTATIHTCIKCYTMLMKADSLYSLLFSLSLQIRKLWVKCISDDGIFSSRSRVTKSQDVSSELTKHSNKRSLSQTLHNAKKICIPTLPKRNVMPNESTCSETANLRTGKMESSNVNEDVAKYKCQLCGSSFGSEQSWLLHVKAVHRLHPKWYIFRCQSVLKKCIQKALQSSIHQLIDSKKRKCVPNLKNNIYRCSACDGGNFRIKTKFVKHLLHFHNINVKEFVYIGNLSQWTVVPQESVTRSERVSKFDTVLLDEDTDICDGESSDLEMHKVSRREDGGSDDDDEILCFENRDIDVIEVGDGEVRKTLNQCKLCMKVFQSPLELEEHKYAHASCSVKIDSGEEVDVIKHEISDISSLSPSWNDEKEVRTDHKLEKMSTRTTKVDDDNGTMHDENLNLKKFINGDDTGSDDGVEILHIENRDIDVIEVGDGEVRKSPNQCKLCMKGFQSPSDLEEHKYSHANCSEKLFDEEETDVIKHDVHGKSSSSPSWNDKKGVRTGHKLEKTSPRTAKICKATTKKASKAKTGKASCSECGDTFPNNLLLLKHKESAHNVISHASKRPLEACKYCGQTSKYRASLKRHIIKVHGEKYSREDYVPFKNFTKIEDEERPTVGPIIKVPADCDGRISPSFKYKCDRCHFHTEEKKELQNHMRVAHELVHPRDECKYCGKLFSTSYLKIHMENMHGDTLKYACNDCPMKFRSISDIVRHRYTDHRKSWKCKHCPEVFSKYHHLQQHQVFTHSTQVHLCSECGKMFYRKCDLTTHIKNKHMEKVRINCTMCSKNYSNRFTLRLHLMKEHGLAREDTYAENYARKLRENNCLQYKPRSYRFLQERTARSPSKAKKKSGGKGTRKRKDLCHKRNQEDQQLHKESEPFQSDVPCQQPSLQMEDETFVVCDSKDYQTIEIVAEPSYDCEPQEEIVYFLEGSQS